ncbi:ATP-binding cassette domain-containing protein [Bradyrhizobium guangxiense]
MRKGETPARWAQSGCGASPRARGAPDDADHRRQGRVRGQIASYSATAMRGGVRRRIQMVYQDPYGSLNPMKVGDIIGEPLIVHGMDTERDVYRARIQELLRLVGLRPDMAERYPHEFSGGQRQRISIAHVP